MSDSESEAKAIIERIADEVRPDATGKRFQRSIQLILESFAPEHVITELLQNADDVEATTVEIRLTKQGMVFVHDGHEFTEQHLRALCDIGETTKKPGIHIGFMGIGFKATFKISDKVFVFSEPYRFYLTREEVIVPYWLDTPSPDIHAHVQRGLTTFFLPFRQDLPSEIIEFLEATALAGLEPLCLVFLKNIQEIKIICESGTRTLVKSKEAYGENAQGREKVAIAERKERKERNFSYLVFHKSLEIPDPVKKDYRAKESRRADLKTTDVTIAFSLKNDIIEPVKSVLYTFLPTPLDTGLRFAVNADFLLNTQRTEIDLVSRWNLWLLESISAVLTAIVRDFVHDEKQRFYIYDLLPRRSEVPDWLFAKIARPLIDYLKINPLILTAEENLAIPSEVVLGSKDVQEIIPPAKAGSKYYVHSRIHGKAFLKEELDIDDYSEAIAERQLVLGALKDKAWLGSLDSKQVRAFYEFLYHKLYGKDKDLWELTWYEHSQLEKELEELEIVRSTGGKYHRARETILPVKSRKPSSELIALPCLVFVDPAVLSSLSLELLRKLGAPDYSEESIINRILDSQAKEEWKIWTEEERLKSVGYVAQWLAKKNYETPNEMKNKLSNLVLPIEGSDWSTASACYLPSTELKEVLPDSAYLDISKIRAYVSDVTRFLNAVGVLGFPRVLLMGEKGRWADIPPFIPKSAWEDYWSWLYEKGHLTYEGRERRILLYALDSFDERVTAQDTGKLTKYLNMVLEHWHDYYEPYKYSKFRWFHYYEKSKDVPSYFAHQIKTRKWLPTTKGLALPNETYAPLKEIKRIGGSLVPYLKISEERARETKEILQFIGVNTEVSLPMLLSVLSMAKNAEVNDDLKAQLGRIYQRMATLCEDETIDQEVHILDVKGSFQQSKKLYWLDDPETERVFGDDIAAVWVPNTMSRPHIRALFKALGVTELSSILERRKPSGIQTGIDDKESSDELRKRGRYLHSILQHYNSNKIDAFHNFITNVVVVKEDHLRIELKVLDKVHEVEVPCFCSLEENRIYISSGAQPTDIARELTRAFGASLGAEFALGFVLTQAPDVILEQLKRSSIQLVPLVQPEVEISIDVAPEAPTHAPPAEPIPALSIEVTTGESQSTPETKFPQPLETGEPSHESKETEEAVSPEVTFETDKEELDKEIEKMKQLLTESKIRQPEKIDVWTDSAKIDKVVSNPRVVVRPFVSASSKKNWELRTIEGEKVFVEKELDTGKLDTVRFLIAPFRERMRKIVEIMGGNPDTVNICIALPETDGDRREGQLFFNISRNDKPLRWIVVVARELAYVKFPKPSQAHTSLMTDLIEKALDRIQEIYPEIFQK
jgi:hypothetical protein